MLKLTIPAGWQGAPWLLCAFRPFFLATLVSAVLLLTLWLGYLKSLWPLPAVAGGPLVWHAHELLFGFGLAAVAGFVFTAVPEFTRTPVVARPLYFWILVLWLLARASFWLSGMIGPWPAALCNIGLAVALPSLLASRLFSDPSRRQWAFAAGLLSLALVCLGFYADLLRGLDPMRWLHAGIGALVALVLIALSRISMRMVNDSLEDWQLRRPHVEAIVYRALPPRRNLAIFCIALYTLAEFFLPGAQVGGWLALACTAALFNVLNDWHVGRALFNRWVLSLYLVYWLMALGYAALGVSLLWQTFPLSAGRHLLTIGGLGLSIFAVIAIAGRTHSGEALDPRPWVPISAVLLVLGALLRLGASLPGWPYQALLGASGLAWIVAFALALRYLGMVFVSPRRDGGTGCEEPLDAGHESTAAPRCG
ncbi:NnrS family protein [Serpens gallinarum]|uniref:NnrS family protein n=1 Tax=Serpens gallinarum TaxID=2763075 RepID=A0ABR8TPH4_9PSED|nr:NnrS family protein [Serpens gallinarum]MBD7977671.1 NnrS family protein [Serpens gallinarum]